jgi:hypothetical protein
MNGGLTRVVKRPVPKVLSNRCPTCGAKPNEPCELATGQPRHEPHIDRRLAVDKKDKKTG